MNMQHFRVSSIEGDEICDGEMRKGWPDAAKAEQDIVKF